MATHRHSIPKAKYKVLNWIEYDRGLVSSVMLGFGFQRKLPFSREKVHSRHLINLILAP